MKYNALGNAGIKVSSISIGGWLTVGGSVERRNALDILHAAVDAGINFIDAADIYAKGKCEDVIGEFLKEYTATPGRSRSDLVLSTKVFWPMSDNPNDKGLGRKHINESIDASLRRMGTDYVDIYYCHRPDPEVSIRETQMAMHDLVTRGKVLYWGTSCWWPEHFDEAWSRADHYGWYGPAVEQPRYNLLDRGIEKDVLPTAGKHGMGVTVWSPLAQGILTGKYNDGRPEGSRGATTEWLNSDLTDDNIARVRRFCAMAEERGVTPAALALAWCAHKPHISSVITGASSTAQVEANVAAATIELSSEDICAIEAAFA
ncbi:MAG: aryl-alcohol dehydrogenase-like predicted oxidoreductase [Bradymonadia bacterium]|jgi:aryl-alcohol dehydrogenase-like predicted oxidoreductase